MKLTGKEDIRVRRTITSIHQAFCDMICEMDYNKITVKELCERAMINKKTFYTYYETMDYLLREVQESYSAPYIAEIRELRFPDDIDQLTRSFFEFSAKQDKAYEKITIASSYNGIRDEMIQTVMNSTVGQDEPVMKHGVSAFANHVYYRFYMENNLMIYEEWLKEGKKTPLEDVIQIALDLMNHGLGD